MRSVHGIVSTSYWAETFIFESKTRTRDYFLATHLHLYSSHRWSVAHIKVVSSHSKFPVQMEFGKKKFKLRMRILRFIECIIDQFAMSYRRRSRGTVAIFRIHCIARVWLQLACHSMFGIKCLKNSLALHAKQITSQYSTLINSAIHYINSIWVDRYRVLRM